ncbi:hypothetical protein CLAIMM_00787 [Cladophialophora immunda]|nr:hypothetical protein CLAIMM_00787 [Cladophialophora immunda]
MALGSDGEGWYLLLAGITIHLIHRWSFGVYGDYRWCGGAEGLWPPAGGQYWNTYTQIRLLKPVVLCISRTTHKLPSSLPHRNRSGPIIETWRISIRTPSLRHIRPLANTHRNHSSTRPVEQEADQQALINSSTQRWQRSRGPAQAMRNSSSPLTLPLEPRARIISSSRDIRLQDIRPASQPTLHHNILLPRAIRHKATLLRREQPSGPYTLLFQPSSQKHTRTLTPAGSNTPTYVATYNRALIYSSAPDISITTSATGAQLATVNWHTWSGKIDLAFPATGAQITYKDSFEPAGPRSASLGRLFWTVTHGSDTQADLRCADRAGATVCTVVLRDKLRSGRVEIWRPGLDGDLFDQVVVSAVAEIEDWKRKVESRNSNPGIIAGGVVAALGN